ncbi:hypothetical protein [Nonomuraea longispora]|uniref:hypothetical protein n=1 Tax=Nonomuraea longispora TaxID=1848320 RepID=UPI0015F2EA10|nr:hypothetical protein [Nonomuraea longispora]
MAWRVGAGGRLGLPAVPAGGTRRRLTQPRAGLAVSANTFEAHRLIEVATRQGLGTEMAERLFSTYLKLTPPAYGGHPLGVAA